MLLEPLTHLDAVCDSEVEGGCAARGVPEWRVWLEGQQQAGCFLCWTTQTQHLVNAHQHCCIGLELRLGSGV